MEDNDWPERALRAALVTELEVNDEPNPTIVTDEEGNQYVVVIPAPSFQAQLDRMEALLSRLVPPDVQTTAAPDPVDIALVETLLKGVSRILDVVVLNYAITENTLVIYSNRQLPTSIEQYLLANLRPVGGSWQMVRFELLPGTI